MNILITGASGFIGSFLCEEALNRNMNVWAGMRTHSSKKYLQDERLNFLTLDLSNTDTLASQLGTFKAEVGKFDIIIHAGGATKCLHKEDFYKHNYDCTRNLVNTLKSLDMVPQQFLYVSSLSVLGPRREEMVAKHAIRIPDGIKADKTFVDTYTIKESVYEPMLATDTPVPNTAYGESKVKSENFLKESGINYTIFRPTGVYGPREKDYFLMAQSIQQHFDSAVGFKPQEITFVYVRDLVNAILAAIGKEVNGKIYSVSDGYVYNSRAFSDLLQKEMGTKYVLHIKFPLWFLRTVCAVSDMMIRITGKMSALNNDKYNILSQRNWQCDITPLQQDLGFTPEWNLERGVKEAVAWYKENGWLK